MRCLFNFCYEREIIYLRRQALECASLIRRGKGVYVDFERVVCEQVVTLIGGKLYRKLHNKVQSFRVFNGASLVILELPALFYESRELFDYGFSISYLPPALLSIAGYPQF